MRTHTMSALWGGFALLLVGSAQGQSLLEIGTTAGQSISTQLSQGYLGGTVPAVGYGHGIDPGLTIRPGNAVLCARTGNLHSNPLKRVVFDPNGYFDPIPLAREAFDVKDGPLEYLNESFLRGSEAVNFGSSAFVMVGQQLAFDVDGVQAYCVLAPAVDTPASSPGCTTIADEDAVFGESFELRSQGSLLIAASSQLQPPLNQELRYEYILRAQGGPVFDVRLREQFPYFLFNQPETVVFGKSLQLQHNWSCDASEGAVCDSRGRTLDGAGYVHLDGGYLAEGSCLKISTTRALNTTGAETQSSFSGRLHAAAIYKTAPTESATGQTTHVAIRQPFAQ